MSVLINEDCAGAASAVFKVGCATTGEAMFGDVTIDDEREIEIRATVPSH